MKGQLVFADEALATELFADLTRDETSFLVDALTREGRKIRARFDEMLSDARDHAPPRRKIFPTFASKLTSSSRRRASPTS